MLKTRHIEKKLLDLAQFSKDFLSVTDDMDSSWISPTPCLNVTSVPTKSIRSTFASSARPTNVEGLQDLCFIINFDNAYQ